MIGSVTEQTSTHRLAFASWWVLILLAAALASSAHAHGDDAPGKPDIRVVMDTLPPALSAMHIEVRNTLAPQLMVSNPTHQPLEILDKDGRAFLRIGAGQVQADLGDAAFHRSNTLMAPGAIKTNRSEPPRWKTVSEESGWGWFDLRLRTDDVDVPHDVHDARQGASVGQWAVPAQLGQVKTAIRGHFEYVPTPTGISEARVTDTGLPAGRALVRALAGSTRPGLFLSYRGEKPLIVTGAGDEPLFRFTSSQVQANQHSPTWARISPAGSPKYQPAGADQAPAWATVSESAGYAWIEPRTEYQGTVESPGQSSIVKHWQIAMTVGDKTTAIKGVTEWHPITPVASAQ